MIPSVPGRRRRSRVAAVAVTALVGLAGAVAIGGEASAATSVQVYWSSESRTAGFEPVNANWYADPATGLAGTPYRLSRQPDVPIVAAGGAATITANTGRQYQSVLGFGSSLEESTIYNLSRMSATARERTLRLLLDPSTGAGFNVARITFGTSDFTSRAFYTYDDGAADPALSRFSIQKDLDYGIINVLKQARQINPNLLIFASVWSPPAWMKANNSLIGGNLLDQHVPTLAAYYRRAVQAYAAQGLPIHAVTLQNEPLYSPPDYPGTLISADQERRLAVAMRAEFTGNGVGGTKIWAFDHNFAEGPSYIAGVLGSPGSPSDAFNAVDGLAFHDYAGEPALMGQVKAGYPAKDVAMTERAVWGTTGANRIVDYLRNQSVMYQNWVTMLDQNRAPEKWTGAPDPTMLVQNPSAPDTVWALPEYYLTAQFAKFIQRGAKRVDTNNGSASTVTNVAFLNPDGSLVTVVVNRSTVNQTFTVRAGTQQFTGTLPAKTVGTYVWADANATPPTGTTAALRSDLSGRCVDVPGANPVDGARLQIYDCNGSAAQQWTISGDGTVRALGKCMDAAAAGTANATAIQLYTCNGTNAQRFTLGAGGDLVNPAANRCVDVVNNGTANGSQLQLWDCAGTANQRWTRA
ncbi:ricin-type beta-trefoil lectin domain protein [Actinoplanes sp. NPDC048967]|uniref:ricin-type beta-trefoil lectin domain protein n=1 Tax=Actinoplanes sp. NPDC048967 TaxID=3155269 RepID=UPI0033F62069